MGRPSQEGAHRGGTSLVVQSGPTIETHSYPEHVAVVGSLNCNENREVVLHSEAAATYFAAVFDAD